jgi:hypothetical protein
VGTIRGFKQLACVISLVSGYMQLTGTFLSDNVQLMQIIYR